MNVNNTRAVRIESILKKKLTPSKIFIKDNTHLHAHHGNTEKGALETHFSIKMLSNYFVGMNKIQMHKVVYDLLKDEFSKGLHALELDLGSD